MLFINFHSSLLINAFPLTCVLLILKRKLSWSKTKYSPCLNVIPCKFRVRIKICLVISFIMCIVYGPRTILWVTHIKTSHLLIVLIQSFFSHIFIILLKFHKIINVLPGTKMNKQSAVNPTRIFCLLNKLCRIRRNCF